MNSSKAPVKILAGVREVNKFNLYKIVQRGKNPAVIEFSTKQTLLFRIELPQVIDFEEKQPQLQVISMLCDAGLTAFRANSAAVEGSLLHTPAP